MAHRLDRLLRPRSVAVVGGGAWCFQVVHQLDRIGFAGDVWPVHPKATEVAGRPAHASLADLPHAPDASFIGVNRHVTVGIVQELSVMGAGGAVCFASGFRESAAEDAEGADLQSMLLTAAGEMPFLGPNCYGLINYLDGALLWPDQHGGQPVDHGVALILQSSNIAINLTMQARGLPIAYVVTAGNQAQMSLAETGMALLEDDRVTALGLHIEGIGDIRAFEALTAKAAALGKPIVALKMGRSAQARAAAVSHTASLAGEDAGAAALLRRLGVARVFDLPTFLETLKLLHCAGPLAENAVATISCSGGEASLAGDLGEDIDVRFPPLTERQAEGLRAALGPRVALANPLDYNTYIWRDVPAMTRAFAAMSDPGVAITLIIADFPRADLCDPADWECVIKATVAAASQTGRPYGLVSTLPELLPEQTAARLLSAGVVPLAGLREALAACAAAATQSPSQPQPVLLPNQGATARLFPEGEAKSLISAFGLAVPRSQRCALGEVESIAAQVGFPQVLKGEGLAHKTEAGAVKLNLKTSEETRSAAGLMSAPSFLIEEMITGTVAELLIGVVNDPAHGFILTLGAGGTLTELWSDTTSLLLPAGRDEITQALMSLRSAPLLTGYRGSEAADLTAILAAIDAVQAFATEHRDRLAEIEINPLICTPTRAVAADVLLRMAD